MKKFGRVATNGIAGLFVLAAVAMHGLGGCGGGGGGNSTPAPNPSPSGIVSVIPAGNATGVPAGTPIRVTFAEDMDPSTLTNATISIRSGGSPVTGSLKYNTLYEVTVSPAVRDASGTPLGSPYSWRFTTEAPPPSSIAGILFLDNNSGVSYDPATRTATMEMNARLPLAGIPVKAVKPSIDNNAILVAEENTTAAASGAFRFQGLVPGTQLITAEGTFPAGPVRRILGVSSAIVTGIPVLLYLPVKDVTPDPAIVRLDEYCLECHPYWDNITGSVQIIRCLHVSGIRPPASYPPSGSYDEHGWMTCTSCHTVHYPTGYKDYAMGSYSTLCTRCHY